MSDPVRELADRLDRLARTSDDGRFSMARLLGRLVRTTRQPKLQTETLTRLLDRIELGYSTIVRPLRWYETGGVEDAATRQSRAEIVEPAADLFAAAVREMAANLARAERTAFVHGRLPDGHLDRLWRLYQVLYRAADWVENAAWRPLLRELICPDARCALSPLVTASSHGDVRPIHGVDALIAAASAEVRSLGRQRRLLEAARQQLLDAGAAVHLSSDGERARRNLLARRIARIDRLEAAGVAPAVDLGYQIREAAARGELPRLCAALSALEQNAFSAGDHDLQRLASRAADILAGGAISRVQRASREASLRASEDQMFGASLRASIDRARAVAAQQLAALRQRKHTPDEARHFTKAFFDACERFLDGRATGELLASAVASDGCFQVGGTVSPARGGGEATRPVLVSFPQQEMVLDPVGDVVDLKNALIGDPRSVLLDLAAGRLLARRYVAMRPDAPGARRLQNEVRVYVLDGSSSMLGARGRMRDALLMAELATLSARLQDPLRAGNQVLYYRYFNQDVAPTRRVADPEEASHAVDDIVGALRYGGTNIQNALLASFEQIRLAAAGDPDLARAQIVLVTDGEAGVDEEKLRVAREAAGTVPIGVSIIALGTQNPELRKLAAHQRAKGERVFYQFIDDEELRRIAEGETAGLPMHVPSNAGREGLTAELQAVLADIERHLRRVDAEQIGSAADLGAALEEVGLPAAQGLDRRTRARFAAIENDRVALDAAFVRAFPPGGNRHGRSRAVRAPGRQPVSRGGGLVFDHDRGGRRDLRGRRGGAAGRRSGAAGAAACGGAGAALGVRGAGSTAAPTGEGRAPRRSRGGPVP